MKDNIILLFQEFKDWMKSKSRKIQIIILSCILLIILSLGMWLKMVVTKTPEALRCTWNGYLTYSLDSDKFRFNWLQDDYNKQCQRLRADGSWVPMEKVSDVGVSGDIEEVE